MTDNNDMISCLCCDCLTISSRGSFEICEVCGWEDDSLVVKHPDEPFGANDISLNDARKAWAARRELNPDTSCTPCAPERPKLP